MRVIFCNVPANTVERELVEFVRSGTKTLFSLFKKDPILDVDFIEVYNEETREKESHGLVTFATEEDGQKAIKSLNGKLLNGKKLRVHEYQSRSPGDKRVSKSTLGLNRPEEHRRKKLDTHKRSEPKKVAAMTTKDENWVD